MLLRRRNKGTATQGHSPVTTIAHGEGIKATQVVTSAREPDEPYQFWRDLANMPRVMPHLEGVEVLSPERSRWTTIGPLGKPISWEAVIHNDEPGELIAWRSVEPSDIANAGSVRFRSAPVGRGTEVRVTIEYAPPLGGAGKAAAKLLGAEPAQQVSDALRRFKRLMETGTAVPIRGISAKDRKADAVLAAEL